MDSDSDLSTDLDEALDTGSYDDDLTKEEKEKNALKVVMYDLHRTGLWSYRNDFSFFIANANRDFYLQFTALSWNKRWKEWELKTNIPIPGTEGIWDCNVEYTEDRMDVGTIQKTQLG
jgi:hypothetical protein